jgi:hypothetical protein
MCRIKKNQNDQFKSSRRDDKIENVSSITEEITLMIKHLIDEAESLLLVNSVNDHITRKILDSETTNHIFCNRSNFTRTFSKFSSARRTRERNLSRRALNRFKWSLLTIRIDRN